MCRDVCLIAVHPTSPSSHTPISDMMSDTVMYVSHVSAQLTNSSNSCAFKPQPVNSRTFATSRKHNTPLADTESGPNVDLEGSLRVIGNDVIR